MCNVHAALYLIFKVIPSVGTQVHSTLMGGTIIGNLQMYSIIYLIYLYNLISMCDKTVANKPIISNDNFCGSERGLQG